MILAFQIALLEVTNHKSALAERPVNSNTTRQLNCIYMYIHAYIQNSFYNVS